MTQFTKDSVVCFLGDSITQNGTWIRRIYDYYRLEQKIPCKIFNCGVGGDQASKGRFRLYETVFCNNPTHVVIAFGMNDVGYNTYTQEPLSDTAVMDRRRKLDTSIAFQRAIAAQCINRGIQVTFCTPTLTDELSEGDAVICPGAAAALLELSLRIRMLAKELNADCIDFSFPFRDILLKLYKKGQTLIGTDRVHPLPEGHEFMARLFLRGQGFDVTVPETFEELHALTQIPHDEWEKRRYQLEMDAMANMYVEWCAGFGIKTKDAMAVMIEESITVTENPYVRLRMENYMANRELIPQRRQALLEHTNTVGKE